MPQPGPAIYLASYDFPELYGQVAPCSSPNSTQVMNTACVGKNQCQVYAFNSVFGDACFGTPKSLRTIAVCSPPPTTLPTAVPTTQPTAHPTVVPTTQPTAHPTVVPSAKPSPLPSSQPVAKPSPLPSSQPVAKPSAQPSRFIHFRLLSFFRSFFLSYVLPCVRLLFSVTT